MHQLICQPTHDKGRILDLVLTEKPGLIKDVDILNQHAVCNSDHFGITFKLRMKTKKIVSKRTIFNYKKANWDGLNRDLNSIRWEQHLKYSEANLGWEKFKHILFHLINKYIPTITVRDNFKPPWFDDESFNLSRKKERLRK